MTTLRQVAELHPVFSWMMSISVMKNMTNPHQASSLSYDASKHGFSFIKIHGPSDADEVNHKYVGGTNTDQSDGEVHFDDQDDDSDVMMMIMMV